MRILFITDKFIPERGGSQIIFGNVYRHLSEHEVVVLTRDFPGADGCDRRSPHRVVRVPYSSIPKLRSPLLWLRLEREARALLTESRFDQVHIGQPAETAPFGTRLAARFGIPAVVHTFAEDVTSHLNHRFYGPRMRRALLAASAVTTISRFTQRHLIELGVEPERIVLMYPGVTAAQWQRPEGAERVREEFGLRGKRVILTLSRLIPRKGHDVVLRALPDVLRRFPEAVYLIVGGGPEEERLRALAKEVGVADSVRWAGSRPNAEAGDFYHASDLFVMPNRRMQNGDVEGFGLVFLEAGACGKPVIGGDTGGTPDAIEHGVTGYLVQPESPEDVGAAILRLLADPALAARLGEQGKVRALGSFTWQNAAASLNRAIGIAGGQPN